MAFVSSPLLRERSIEVVQGSSSAASELTYALFEERTRSATRRVNEGYILSEMICPPTPILKPSKFGGAILSKSSSLTSKQSVEETSVAVKKEPETVTYAQLSFDKMMEKKETSSTSSSEKENDSAPKESKKKKKGIMRFLRPRSVQGKPSKVEKKSVKSKPRNVGPVQKNLEPAWANNVKEEDKVVAFVHDDPPELERNGELEEAAILEKAKEYTLKSTALLELLKSDNGNEDVTESIKQAKLAYEYAMKARELYNSVGSRNGKPLCDDSVTSFSVASSHVTEKAGNVTPKSAKSLLSDISSDSSALQSSRPDTPLSSLLVDLTGNIGPNDAAESTPGSIEIEHDGRILFEAPDNSPSSMYEERHANAGGTQDMLHTASSFRANEGVDIDTESEAQDSPDRTRSPLSRILGVVAPKAAAHCLSVSADTRLAVDDDTRPALADGVRSAEETNAVEEKVNTSAAILKQVDETASVHSDDMVPSAVDDVVEMKRVKSEIFHPPALHPSRSIVKSSDNTAPRQKLLIRHQESRMDGRMKDIEARQGIFSTFPEIKCSSGLECVAVDQDTNTKRKGKDKVRITVDGGMTQSKKGLLSRRDYKLQTQTVDGNARPDLWQRARSSSQAVRKWTREEYEVLQSQLREATEVAEEILNGEVNVIAEVNPFNCSSGSILKQNFDDDTYETRSEESESLLSDGPESSRKQTFDDDTYETQSVESGSGSLSDGPETTRKQPFDDDTYETQSVESGSLSDGPEITDDEEQTLETCETHGTYSTGSIIDTVSLGSTSAEMQHEGFEVYDKTEWKASFDSEWKASFDNDWKEIFDNGGWKEAIENAEEYSTGTDSFDALPHEMTVLGTASSSDSSEEQSSSESDATSVSSISSY